MDGWTDELKEGSKLASQEGRKEGRMDGWLNGEDVQANILMFKRR